MTEQSSTELNWGDIHAMWLDFRSMRSSKESYQRSIAAFFKHKIGDDIAFFKHKIGDDIPTSEIPALRAELINLKDEHEIRGEAYNKLFNETHQISKAFNEKVEELKTLRDDYNHVTAELANRDKDYASGALVTREMYMKALSDAEAARAVVVKNAKDINENYVLREHFEATKDTLNRTINAKEEQIDGLQRNVTILGVLSAGLIMAITYTQFIL